MRLHRLLSVLVLPGLFALPAGRAAADPPGTVSLPLTEPAYTVGLGPGRAYGSEFWTSPGALMYRFPVTKSGSSITVGGGTFVDYLESGLRMSVSSNRALYDNGELRYEGSSSSASVGPNSNRIVRLSGNRALFVQKVGTKEWPALYNVKTGAWNAPFGTGADRRYPTDLWGEYFVYATPDNAIHRRDLRTGTVTTVKSTGGPKIIAVGVYASRVAWLTACPEVCNQTVNWRTVGSGPVSTRSVFGGTSLRLGGGKIAYDRYIGSEHQLVVQYFDGEGQIIGPLGSTNPWNFDLYDETVAWLKGTEIRLSPLSPHAESPRYLGNAIGAASFHPPALWRGAFPVSKPLTDCKVTFRKNGTAVRIIGCAASSKTGLPTVSWDGKTGSGKPVSKGTYTWTLTGADAEGKLLWYNGSGTAISGTVKVV